MRYFQLYQRVPRHLLMISWSEVFPPMRFPVKTVAAVVLLVSLPCFASARPRRVSGSAHASVRHASLKSHKSERVVAHHEAPPAMPPERATAIQTALIRSGYLSGAPTGKWDAETVAAMQKLQDDNGWQTKFTPDSRALIKLGLGPQQASN